MLIDVAKAKALRTAPLTVDVERGRLRFFATATSQSDPIYFDVDAAKHAGHPDLPVPPTFFFSLELEADKPFAYLTELGVDLRCILHGEQGFIYHRLAYAGETLVLQPKVVDVYSKKGGALQFVIKRTDITRDTGEPVAETLSTIVVRHSEVNA